MNEKMYTWMYACTCVCVHHLANHSQEPHLLVVLCRHRVRVHLCECVSAWVRVGTYLYCACLHACERGQSEWKPRERGRDSMCVCVCVRARVRARAREREREKERKRERERERETAYCSGRRRESWPGAATDISVADTCRSTSPTYHVCIMRVREGEGGRERDIPPDRQSGREGGREGEREGGRKYLLLRRADTRMCSLTIECVLLL